MIQKRWLVALILWLVGVALFSALDWWAISSSRKDAENQLIGEAGRTAAQISAMLARAGGKVDQATARAMINASMEDVRLYAVKITRYNGLKEGQRRNYLWEPVAWDDEILENCVQGMDPIRVNGQNIGTVEVWLSPRINNEELSLLNRREQWRLAISLGLWTFAFVLLFQQWGVFAQIKRAIKIKTGVIPETAGNDGPRRTAGAGKTTAEGIPLVDSSAAMQFCGSPEAWPVITGMFRQTFGRGPLLLSRLYSDHEIPGLCHLGRMLEQAAPCLGATPLEQAAREMQKILNDPASKHSAIAVDACARILEQTLEALGEERGSEIESAQDSTPQEQEG